MNPVGGLAATILLLVSGYCAWAYFGAGEAVWSAVAGVVALLALYWSVIAWLRSTVIVVRRAELTISRSMLGFASRREIATDASTDITIGDSGEANERKISSLRVQHEGSQVKICGSLRSRSEAQHLRDLMLVHLKPDAPRPASLG